MRCCDKCERTWPDGYTWCHVCRQQTHWAPVESELALERSRIQSKWSASDRRKRINAAYAKAEEVVIPHTVRSKGRVHSKTKEIM
jgi:hypothetical protein